MIQIPRELLTQLSLRFAQVCTSEMDAAAVSLELRAIALELHRAASAICVDESDALTRVLRVVAATWQVDICDLFSRERTQHLADARQAAMALMRETCPAISCSRIGKLFSGRDHATVLNARDAIPGKVLSDANFRALWHRARRSLQLP